MEIHVLDVYVLAHKYKVETLKYLCDCYIASRIVSVKTILELCEFVKLYEPPIIFEACKSYVKANKEIIKDNTDWKEIKKRHPEMAVQILEELYFDN
ncbi:hypothetical protein ACQ4LE_010834 [Meloidogyne hapla]